MFKKAVLIFSLVLNIGLSGILAYEYIIPEIVEKFWGTVSYSDNVQYDRKVSLFEVLSESKADVAMVGDSLTEGARWDEFFPDVKIINRGICSDITSGVENRISSIIKTNPEKIFLMIGINDIALGIEQEEIYSNIESIIKKISSELPETKIYIQSILPVASDDINRQTIININTDLQKLCESNGITYVDLHSRFVNEDGYLNTKYADKDGLHLNGLGYGLWREIIKEYII